MELPDLFVKRMHDLLADEAEGVLKALAEEPVVSVRLNPAKCTFGCAGDSVPWATD